MAQVQLLQAFSLRINQLLVEKNMNLNKLKQTSGLSYSTLINILKMKNKNIKFKTVVKLAKGFNMELFEFLDYIAFSYENLTK